MSVSVFVFVSVWVCVFGLCVSFVCFFRSSCFAEVKRSALQEDRTPLGTGAGNSHTHLPPTPTRAVTSKSDVLLRRSPDFAEVLDTPERTQEFTITGERVWSESGSGNHGDEVHRGSEGKPRSSAVWTGVRSS